MTDFLLQLLLPLSLLLLLLLVAQKVLLKPIGARSVYALWAAVPVFLLTSIFISFVPVAIQSDVIKHYQVGLQQVTSAVSATNWLFWLWLLGVALCSTYLLLNYLSSRAQYLRAAPLQLTPAILYCRQADDNSGPYITGLFVPHILLPHDFFTRFDAIQQQLILQHELTHWRRGDLHLNYLALALVCLFWFNPLVWLAYRNYRTAQELACDALVTRDAAPAERIAYGYALLSSTQQPSINWWPLTHHYGDFNTMKQRIMQLQQQQGFSKTAVLTALALVIATTLLLQQPAQAGADKATQLTAVSRVEPRYPVQAAQQGISGYVQIQFDVDAQGNVQNAKVIKAVPEQTFELEAVKAVSQWKYNATGQLHKAQRVQLDFGLDTTPTDMERTNVVPSHKKHNQGTD